MKIYLHMLTYVFILNMVSILCDYTHIILIDICGKIKGAQLVYEKAIFGATS